MPKLKRLGFRVPLLDTTRRSSLGPIVSDRMRGSAAMKRNARLSKENPFCVECTKLGKRILVDVWDHKIPLADGGPDVDSNMQGLCIEHHDIKTAREARERAEGGGRA